VTTIAPPRAGVPAAPAPPPPWPRRAAAVLRRHWLIAVLVAAGAVLRVVTQLAYRPALLYWDSLRYLHTLPAPDPAAVHPAGYTLVLRPLLALGDLALVPAVQHAAGLGLGLLLYALCVRHRVPRWLAALAAAPVLLDAYQLQIEQNVLADTLFQALVAGGLAVLTWRARPSLRAAAAGGLLLGLSVPVRTVGLPLVLAAVLFVVVATPGWGRRLLAAAVTAGAFALPVGAYAAWYAAATGAPGLSSQSAIVQYARTADLADCAELDLPDALDPLCPSRYLQRRLIVDRFVWGEDSPAATYVPPPGMTRDEAFSAFARRVVAAQPLDVAGAVLSDFAKGFAPQRVSDPDEVALERWQFQEYYPLYEAADATSATTPPAATAIHGGGPPTVEPGLARWLRGYQLGLGATSGLVLLGALLVAVLAAAGIGRARRSPLRSVAMLWGLAGGGLLLAAAMYLFSWRYQLPGLVLLPPAGALGLTALLRPPPPARDGIDDAAVDAAAIDALGELRLHPLAVVIAAYDEQDAIGAVLDAVPAEVCGLATSTVVVVDGATDATAREAAAHGAVVCDVPVNRGQGAALRLGYRIAREGGAQVLATLDADGQYDPAELALVVAPIVAGEADFVTGSRRLGSEQAASRVRWAGTRVFAALVTLLTRQRITDTSNGLRAMRADVTAAVTLAQPQYQASELLIGVLARGYRVVERPTTMRLRTAGASKKGGDLLYGLRYARVVLGTWWRERSRR